MSKITITISTDTGEVGVQRPLEYEIEESAPQAQPERVPSWEQATTALCIFEHCLDTTYFIKGPVDSAQLEWFKQEEGICQARDNILRFAPFVDAAFEEIADEYDWSFDLDFVPAFIDKVIKQGSDIEDWFMYPNLYRTVTGKRLAKQILEEARP